MISRPILLGSTGLALLLSGVAFAMPQVPIIPLDTRPGETYITLDAQYSEVPEDHFQFLKTCPFDSESPDAMFRGKQRCDREDKTPFLDLANSIDAYGGGAIIGITGDNPWFNGERQRFELGFAVLSGDRRDHRSELFGGENDADMVSMFDGKGGDCNGDTESLSRCGNRPIGLEARANTEYDAFNIVARTLIDFPLSSSFTLTPNFGFVYRHTERHVHATASWIEETDSPSGLAMNGSSFRKWLPERDELIRTNELGVELGATLSFNVSDAFKLFGGVNGEVVYREGQFNGSGGETKHGGCGGGGPAPSLTSSSCNRGLIGLSRRDRVSEDDTAYNVTLSLGAAYSFRGGTTISVIGYAQNESYLIAKKSHSQNNEPTTLETSDRGRGRWNLESERDWTPGVVVALTVPFGGS